MFDTTSHSLLRKKKKSHVGFYLLSHRFISAFEKKPKPYWSFFHANLFCKRICSFTQTLSIGVFSRLFLFRL